VLFICSGVVELDAQLRIADARVGIHEPDCLVQDPIDRAVQFVVQQDGHIRVVRGASVSGELIDLSAAIVSGGEQGLLGLAFPPDATSSGRFFVDFTNRSGDTRSSRGFRRPNNGVIGDPASRFDLRWGGANGQAFIAQPCRQYTTAVISRSDRTDSSTFGLGDGGSGDDPDHRAQTPVELLGKMLRIDVSVPDTHPTGYQIPVSNPVCERRERGGAA